MLINTYFEVALHGQDSQQFTLEIPNVFRVYHERFEHLLLNHLVDSASILYDEMIHQIDTTEQTDLQAWVWYHYGDILSYGEKYAQSNSAYEKAIELNLSTDKPNVKLLARAYNNLNFNLDHMGLHDAALQNILKAYQYALFLSDGRDKANILFNLADNLRDAGDYTLASDYIEKVMIIDKQLKDDEAIAHDLRYLAELCYLRSDYISMRNYLEESLFLIPDHSIQSRATVLKLLAECAMSRNEIDSSVVFINQAIRLAREGNAKSELAEALSVKSEICKLNGDNICEKIAANEAKLIAESLQMNELLCELRLMDADWLSGHERTRLLLD